MTKKKKSNTSKKKKIVQLKGMPSWYQNQRLQMIFLFTLGFLMYANTFGHDYAQDDVVVITKNRFTQQGLKGISSILKYDNFYGYYQPTGEARLISGGRYRPLTLVSFAIETAIWGQNPTLSHILNALFFASAGVLLYLLLLQFLVDKKHEKSRQFIALATAILFIVHPIHTEAVANIKGRDEIFAFLGSIGALYFALLGFRQKDWKKHLLGASLFFLGIMSKESTIAFLGIIPLSLYYFAGAKPKGFITATLPYMAVAFIFIAIRTSILGFTFTDPIPNLMNDPFLRFENGEYVPITFMERMATITYTLGRYIQLLFFPHPLTHDYYPRYIDIMSWSNPKVVLSLLLYIFLIVYAIRGLFRKDLVAYGILFYLFSLSIVSNIVFPIGTNMAERLMFAPSAGFCFVIAVLLFRLAMLLNGNKPIVEFRQLHIPMIVLALYSIGLTVKTISRNPAWKDNYTLFTTDVKTSKNSAKIYFGLGSEIIEKFSISDDPKLKEKKLREAIEYELEAIRIHPSYQKAYLLIGNAYYFLNEYDESIEYYQKALNLNPDYENAIVNIGIAYRDAGKYYGEQGRLKQGLQYLLKAEEYLPEDYEVLRLLGVTYAVSKNGPRAISYFSKAAELFPDVPDIWYNLGNAYFLVGDREQGNIYRQKAISMDPKVVERMRGGN